MKKYFLLISLGLSGCSLVNPNVLFAQSHSLYLCNTASPKTCVQVSFDGTNLNIPSNVNMNSFATTGSSSIGATLSITNNLRTGGVTRLDSSGNLTNIASCSACAVAGSGISVGAGTTVSNTGVLSNIAGSGISVSSSTGNVTITNTGVTSNNAGGGISVSSATGANTISNTGVLTIASLDGTLNFSSATGVVSVSGAGITGTKTVRDAAGTGTCTLVYTGGILTGGTC